MAGEEIAQIYITMALESQKFIKGLHGAEKEARGFGSSLKGILETATGFALGGAITGGITAIGASLFGAAKTGLDFNSSMEMVTAKLNAFTKDGAKSAEILEMIKTRAAQTPFEFQAMAEAVTALMPSAKQSGASLEYLTEQAEILAASNPAEGLEGAAFALKEAVSGDFTSIIERFNLPRQFINQLKEEGVPNLEIVQRAMQELGLDTDLVTNLANTASGRWSTFMDTLTNLAGTLTAPIFEAFSTQLARVNDYLAANEPLLTTMATNLAGKVGGAVSWLVESGLPMLQQFANWFTTSALPAIQPVATTIGTLLVGAVKFLGENLNWLLPILGTVSGVILLLSSPVAVVAVAITALALAWQNNFLGIQTITSAAIAFLQPYFTQLQTILNQFTTALLPPLMRAWQTLVGVWKNELRPALGELFTAFGELFTEIFGGGPKVDNLQLALDLLKLSLDGVIVFVRLLTPMIKLLADGIVFGVEQVTRFVEMLTSMRRAAEDIISPLQEVANKIQEMISAATEMPDWLVPGSPTPFEMGLRGIGDAVRQMPDMTLPDIPAVGQVGANGPAPAAAGGEQGRGVVIQSLTIQANGKKEGQAAGRAFVEELRNRGLAPV